MGAAVSYYSPIVAGIAPFLAPHVLQLQVKMSTAPSMQHMLQVTLPTMHDLSRSVLLCLYL
jgi:hypothetical protein